MNLELEIQRLLVEAGKDNVFKNEVIEEVANTIKLNNELQERIESQEARIKNLEKDKQASELRAKKAEHINASWGEREDKIIEREKKITELELNAKHEAQRVNDHKEMVSLIFRNTKLSNQMFGNIPVADANGYPISMQVNKTTDITEE